ncbi:MAG: glycosyltransferase family 2 protein [Cyclobacteriaceae bacterium]|nr:glycosyltransferase family 2 protein [Cyclobacteriaceae bacterium]
MDTQPLITAIIPFFNEELFLNEAIESVVNQTYTNWELILADDGSDPHVSEIAKGWATRQPHRIFYMDHEHHANKGVCVTRNAAIAKARGEYIALLDADDYWHPGKIEFQVQKVWEYPKADMIVGASNYWRSWNTGNVEDDIVVKVAGLEKETFFKPGELTPVIYPMTEAAAPCPSSFLIRKQFCIDIGGFENDFRGDYQLYEDQAFLSKVYLHGHVLISPLCFENYRQRKGSCVDVVSASGKYHEVRKYFLKWFARYLTQHRISNPGIQKSLQTALMRYKKPLWYKIRFELPRKLENLFK